MLIMISSHSHRPLQRNDCLPACLVYLRREISVDIKLESSCCSFWDAGKQQQQHVHSPITYISNNDNDEKWERDKNLNWNKISLLCCFCHWKSHNLSLNEEKKRSRIAYKSFDFCVTQDKNMNSHEREEKNVEDTSLVGHKQEKTRNSIDSARHEIECRFIYGCDFFFLLEKLKKKKFDDIDDSEQKFKSSFFLRITKESNKKYCIELFFLLQKSGILRIVVIFGYYFYNLDFI